MSGYKWYTIMFLVLLIITQPNLSDWFSINGTVISFVLFFVMMAAFGKKLPDIFIAAFVLGMVYDMMYSPWLGRMTIVLVISALSVMIVGKIVYKENMPVLTLYFFGATYILENIRTFLEVGPGIFINSFAYIQGEMLRMSVYAAGLAAVFGTLFFISSIFKDRRAGARRKSAF